MEQCPHVRDTTEQATYVGNQLASRDDEQQTTELALSTRQCLRKVGFQMVKYASSHPATLQCLPVEVCSSRQTQSLALCLQEGDLEPALRLCWNWKSELYHPAKVPDSRVLTKRIVMKMACAK